MTIRTRRLFLELVVPGEVGPERDETDPDVLRYFQEAGRSPWRDEWDRRLRQVFWIKRRDGKLIGEAELADIRRGEGVAELRICLSAPGTRGKGYGEEAVTALLEFAEGHLSLKEVYLRVYEQNARAVACYLKCGFKRKGRLKPGRFHKEPVLLMVRPLRPINKSS